MDTVPIKGQAKSVFTTVFVTLGVILVLIVMAVGYIVVADPLHIKPLLFGSSSGSGAQLSETTTANTQTAIDTPAINTPTTPESFTLSEAQREALRGFGIDPATVPSTITPLQVACFEEQLGASRVSEIRAGGVPSAFELFKVKSCIN